MTKEIQLTRGMVAIVDDADFDELNKYKWCASKGDALAYAVRRGGIFGKSIFMHRVIAGNPDGMHVDHLNGNKLDNRRSNLRACTSSENGRNRGKQSDNTSGFKGVFWQEHAKMWRAKIKIHQKQVHIGYFDNKEEAARAYDEAARKYHGEFARTNF